ncbi:hypothetical protein D9M68_540330 [compost metagenome]
MHLGAAGALRQAGAGRGRRRQRGDGADLGGHRRVRAFRHAVHHRRAFRGRRRCRSGRRRRGAGDLELEDQVAGADFGIQLDQHLLDHAGARRGDFHARLVRFQGDQRLLGRDRVAGLDQHLDDLGLAGRADVRDVDVLHARAGGGGRCRSRCGGRRLGGRGSSRRCGLGRRGRRSGFGAALGFQFEQLVAFLQAVAELDLEALHHPGLGSRDLHAGLVRLQGQQALVGFDTVADLDEQLDNFTLTAADVGYANQFTHRSAPQQSRGLAFSGSMPNLAMASATTFASSSPRSTSASRAASTIH